MTLIVLEGHSLIASFFYEDVSYISAQVNKISTVKVLRMVPLTTAKLLYCLAWV